MKIKNVQTRSDIFLAPMAGVTDIGFRKICRDFGAGLTYTEMISVKGLYYENKKTSSMLRLADNETPSCVQLFGSDPDIFRKVIMSGVLDKFDIIDINFGCPAPKIVKNGDGSALLKDLPKIEEIVTKCVKATKKPITVKIRIGYEIGHNVAVQVAKICERCGAKAITVHGRTREQMYSGDIDYETIKKVKQAVAIPVIGNGNVFDEQSYRKMLETGVDGVMLARGALGQPWLFSILKGKTIPNKYSIVETHVNILKKYYPEDLLCTTLRKHFLWYVRDIEGGSKYKLKLATTTNLDESLKILKDVLL